MRRFAGLVLILPACTAPAPSPDAGLDAGSDAGMTCTAHWNTPFTLKVLEEDGGVFSSAFDAGVTVVEVTDAGAVLFEAAGRKRVQVVLDIPGLPTGFISIGQQFELSVGTPMDRVQTLALSAAGSLRLIGMSGSASSFVAPELRAGDVTVTDDGVACSTIVNPQCTRNWHRARVVADGGEARLLAGESARVGPYRFTVADLHDGNGCDVNLGVTALAGFRVP